MSIINNKVIFLAGCMYSMAAFGPVLGFLLGAYLLSFHMDSFSGQIISIGKCLKFLKTRNILNILLIRYKKAYNDTILSDIQMYIDKKNNSFKYRIIMKTEVKRVLCVDNVDNNTSG